MNERERAELRDAVARARVSREQRQAGRPTARRSHTPDLDRRVIVRALRLAGHYTTEIARLLDVSPSTVYKDLAATPVELADERDALLARLEHLDQALSLKEVA